MARGAVIVQLHDLLRGQRRILAPRLAQIAEQIGVLDVKLPLVDFMAAEDVCHFFQVVELRHTPAGAVLIVPAVRKVRPVLDFEGGQHCAVLLDVLAKRLHAVAQRFVTTRFQGDTAGRDGQGVMVGGQGAVDCQHHVPRFRVAARKGHVETGVIPQAALQHLRIEKCGRLGADQRDMALCIQCAIACRVVDFVGIGQKFHFHYLVKKETRAAGAYAYRPCKNVRTLMFNGCGWS